jgi:hypothetical protein
MPVPTRFVYKKQALRGAPFLHFSLSPPSYQAVRFSPWVLT